MKRELQKLQDQIDQLRYDMDNKPKYKVGDKLEDGTVVTNVEKINVPRLQIYEYDRGFFTFGGRYVDVGVQTYIWNYKGVRKGEIINVQ